MFRIGSHISSAKGYLAMGREAVAIGANVFQFFPRNPRGGRAKALDENDVAAFRAFAEKNGLGTLLAHASYTLNPASGEERLRTFARDVMADDLARLEHTPGNMYNFHPGHARDGDRDRGVAAVASLLDEVVRPDCRTTVLVETMVGGGNELGGSFEELRAILDAAAAGEKMGVCLDTCHVFNAGYDIAGDLDAVLTAFDKAVGLDRLRAVHLNDSKFPLGSGKDRHAGIGEGEIGLPAIKRIVNHPALRDLPFYLETPNDPAGYAREIAMLKKYRKTPKNGSPAKGAGGAAPARGSAR